MSLLRPRLVLFFLALSVVANGEAQAFERNTPRQSLSAEEIESAFAAANSWLKPEMMSVSCRGENLLDVGICFGRDLFPRACGANEEEARLCRSSKIAVPPATPARP